jgi:hypothetical protein
MKQIKRLKPTITNEDINGAVKGKSNKCMIQHAIKRDYPDLQNIYVDKFFVRVTDPKANAILTFNMSAFGRVQLLKFDAGENVEPFKLRLTKPVVRFRTRKNLKGSAKPASAEDSVGRAKLGGPIRTPKTPMGRRLVGRDRVFGQRLFTDELRKLRESLEVKSAEPELQIE